MRATMSAIGGVLAGLLLLTASNLPEASGPDLRIAPESRDATKLAAVSLLPLITEASATQIALAMDIPLADIVTTSLGTSDQAGAGVSSGPVGTIFPTWGSTFGILATGLAVSAEAPNDHTGTGWTLNGLDNSEGNDMVQLTLRLRPPEWATCLSFEAAFYSEEFPEFVGSRYNDAFTAEFGATDLRIVNGQVVSALNVAFDTQGNPISINTVFGVTADTATTYDGATPLFRVISPLEVTPSPDIDLYLSIQDVGDSLFDSAVFLDHFAWLSGDCQPGAFVDTDSDSLPDEWEIHGLDVDADGLIDLDLPAMGANPNVRDIFVEVDYMVERPFCSLRGCAGGHSHKPENAALERVVRAFRDSGGVMLHVDAGPDTVMDPWTGALWGDRSLSDALPHEDHTGTCTTVTDGNCDNYSWSRFDEIKNGVGGPMRLSLARRDVFHYAIFAHQLGDATNSGLSRGIPASDFLVTLGPFRDEVGTVSQQAGTFMHELGHNLNLCHGGPRGVAEADQQCNVNYKPNYLSVMNYSFQLTGLIMDGAPGTFDYSFATLGELDENDLDEPAGLGGGAFLGGYGTRFFSEGDAGPCAGFTGNRGPQGMVTNVNDPIDWTCDGDDTDSNSAVDINGDAGRSRLKGYNDWNNLRYDGGVVGKLGQSVELPSETQQQEITLPESQEIRTPHAVSVRGPGEIPLLPGEGQDLVYEIRNDGENPDVYELSFHSDLGWGNPRFASNSMGLDPGESTSVLVSVIPPLGSPAAAVERIVITAQSLSASTIMDSATTIARAAVNPPVAQAGADHAAECGGPAGTSVTLDGSASTSPGGGSLLYQWTGPFPEGGGTVMGVDPVVTLPLGQSIVTLRVNDGVINSYPDALTITVVDTTPPAVSVSASPSLLWPPNHQMVPVQITPSVLDACDPQAAPHLVSVTSSEPDDASGEGDGHTTNDIQNVVQGAGPTEVLLRAERAEGGSGRTYTVTYESTDQSGNIGLGTAQILVVDTMAVLSEPILPHNSSSVGPTTASRQDARPSASPDSSTVSMPTAVPPGSPAPTAGGSPTCALPVRGEPRELPGQTCRPECDRTRSIGRGDHDLALVARNLVAENARMEHSLK